MQEQDLPSTSSVHSSNEKLQIYTDPFPNHNQNGSQASGSQVHNVNNKNSGEGTSRQSSNELKWEDYNVGPNALKNVVQRTIGHISEHTPPDEAKVVTRGQSQKANAPKNEKKSAPQTRMNVNPENPPDHANLRNAYRVPVKNTYSILGDLNTMRANISIASFIRVAPTRAYFNIQYCQPSVRWGLPVTNKGVYLLD